MCGNPEVLEHPASIECPNCGHEWVLGPGRSEDSKEHRAKSIRSEL